MVVAVGTEQQHVEMQLSLSPISLQRLSDRLAWLPLAGSIARQIPKLTLTADSLQVADDVNMDLFDGAVRIENLMVLRPFSALSQLHADVFVEGIDLGVLSRAFSFGQIEGAAGRFGAGPCSGELAAGGLRCRAWNTARRHIQAPHFAACGRQSRQPRWGASGPVLNFPALFRGVFLCTPGLELPACSAGSVKWVAWHPPRKVITSLRGGGLPPRVDVVGFNRRVDWHTLLDRLKAVTSSEGPVDSLMQWLAA